MNRRIHLSVPHLSGHEGRFVEEALASNWVAPLGPNVDAFEREMAERVGATAAAALSSGTAALHLALELAGVRAGDEVLCSTLTFVATANPILYLGARPVFVDCERTSWNIDPALVAEALDRPRGPKPAAVIAVDLFGQCADFDPLIEACDRHGVPLIEDAAEALGATYKGRQAGTLGAFGVYSFNGNKIITTSGGGMLVGRDPERIERARWLASQARDLAPHYQHSSLGYNYRMSNVLAGVGLGQLLALDDRIAARRANFAFYEKAFRDACGITMMPEATWGMSTHWLSVLLIDEAAFGASAEAVRLHLAEDVIEARPVWKPLHQQPLFEGARVFGGEVAEDLFARGLCLPSGSQLTSNDLERVAARVLSTPRKAVR